MAALMRAAALALIVMSAHAMAAGVRIPEASARYRLRVDHCSAEYFGLDASPARLAAQLHQESGWRAAARSSVAHGLAQFVPATARWLPEICPELGSFDPWDPQQAICAAACYDAWLLQRVQAASLCDRWAFALAAYNGGESWVRRDRALTDVAGGNPDVWFGQVSLHSRRSEAAMRENRSYVSRILLRLEPAYIDAGWAGEVVCP